MPSEASLTASQHLWLQCHLALDDGLDVCVACDMLGHGRYCMHCGARLVPEGRECPQCGTPGFGTYCMQCGTALPLDVAEAMEDGTFDWDDWRRSLTPFLGGLTPAEKRLLALEGVGYAG